MGCLQSRKDIKQRQQLYQLESMLTHLCVTFMQMEETDVKTEPKTPQVLQSIHLKMLKSKKSKTDFPWQNQNPIFERF